MVGPHAANGYLQAWLQAPAEGGGCSAMQFTPEHPTHTHPQQPSPVAQDEYDGMP